MHTEIDAIHDVTVELLPLATGQEKQRWRVYFDGVILVSNHTDPEHAACRELQKLGYTGLLRALRDGTPYMTMPLAWGAARCTRENRKNGLGTTRYTERPQYWDAD